MKKEQNEITLWQIIKGYFNALPDRSDEKDTIAQISSGVAFHGSNLWILVFAIFIASLGLNVNSTAVIIGAMLISPLMGPITGMGLAVGINDIGLLRRSIKSYLIATVISVLTAAIYFLISPLTEARSELLSRTSPSLYDVLIALCGGAAGILALATKGKGNVIPGVAIATALMPPLCTAGYGLAVGNASFFFGAFYLFFINTVFIALSTFVGVRMLRFRRKQIVHTEKLAKMNKYIIGIVLLTMLPATYMTVQIIRQSVLDNNMVRFVKNELSFKGTQIISENRNDKAKTLNVVAIGQTISESAIKKAREQMDKYGLDGYWLHVIQGSQTDSLLSLEQPLNATGGSNVNKQKLVEQADQVRVLERKLDAYTRYSELSKEIRGEVKAVCPSATSISLSSITEVKMDTVAVQAYILAVVKCRSGLNSVERKRLHSFLKERVKADSLRLLITE